MVKYLKSLHILHDYYFDRYLDSKEERLQYKKLWRNTRCFHCEKEKIKKSVIK